MVLGIAKSLESNSNAPYFEITSDGQICTDPANDIESVMEEPIMERIDEEDEEEEM